MESDMNQDPATESGGVAVNLDENGSTFQVTRERLERFVIYRTDAVANPVAWNAVASVLEGYAEVLLEKACVTGGSAERRRVAERVFRSIVKEMRGVARSFREKADNS
jgi:hypothetical protein